MGSDGAVRPRAGSGRGCQAGVAGGSATHGPDVPSAGRNCDAGGDDDLFARHDRDLKDVWDVLLSIRHTVENDHAHRLRRIETDLRWVIVLLGGLIIAVVGAALGGVFGG